MFAISILGDHRREALARSVESAWVAGRASGQAFAIRVLDMGPRDGLEDTLRRETVTWIRLPKRVSFPVAHSMAIRFALEKAEEPTKTIFLRLDPSARLRPDALAVFARSIAESSPEIGVWTPKVLRAYAERLSEEEGEERTVSEIRDGSVFSPHPLRFLSDAGAGNLDKQEQEACTVFGATGACVAYRLSMLASLITGPGYGSSRLPAERQDADISWCLQGAGVGCRSVPQAVVERDAGAFHAREPRSLWIGWPMYALTRLPISQTWRALRNWARMAK